MYIEAKNFLKLNPLWFEKFWKNNMCDNFVKSLSPNPKKSWNDKPREKLYETSKIVLLQCDSFSTFLILFCAKKIFKSKTYANDLTNDVSTVLARILLLRLTSQKHQHIFITCTRIKMTEACITFLAILYWL